MGPHGILATLPGGRSHDYYTHFTDVETETCSPELNNQPKLPHGRVEGRALDPGVLALASSPVASALSCLINGKPYN